MSDDALFPDLSPEPAASRPTSPTPVGPPDWQLASLRKLLDDLGLTSMDDRKALIEELAGRPVTSLRDLTFAEANEVLDRLVERKKPADATKSAWDDRDSDTWIDRL